MIKYRVYDTEDKEYLDSSRTAITPYDEVFILSDYKYNDDGQEIWEAKLVCSARQEPGRFVIEQYTGLKDANGKDIYEGDIVTYYPRHEGVPYKVYWARESAKFLIGRTGVLGQELSSVMHNLDTGRIALEVIGNIHENPDLISARDKNVPSKER